MHEQESEEAFKAGHDLKSYVSVEPDEQIDHIGFRASLAQCYVRGGVELHFHARVEFPEGDVEDLCAVFKAAEVEFFGGNHTEVGNESTGGIAATYAVGRAAGRAPDEAQCLVPVDTGKLVENPQGVGVRVEFPTVVRLQLLDDCLRLWTDCPDLMQSTPRGEFAGLGAFVKYVAGEVDWESGMSGRLSTDFRFSQGPSEMVQGRTHVLEAIPDDEGQQLRRLLHHIGADDVVGAVQPSLSGESVRLEFKERFDLPMHRHQMLIRSVEFEAGTRE